VDWAIAARAMQVSGQTETALKLALKVWNESAGDPEAALIASEVLSADVPAWHFNLLRDQARNAAYDAALRRLVRPGMRVLDIGSGTGLLAMMAARAGAAQVFSCEMNPAVAEAAKEIVAANGFSDRIKILGKHSGELDADADLGGRVDLIVSELVSNNMVAEGVLTSMPPAVENLLKPGCPVVPAGGTVRIALAFDPNLSRKRVGTDEGFDLRAFNRLAKPIYQMTNTKTELQLMSDSVDLFDFDFCVTAAVAEERAQRVLIARGGPVNCIAQWIYLEMDDEGRFENMPGGPDYSNWAVLVRPLATPADMQAGDAVTVNGWHDLFHVRIWVVTE